MDARRYAGLRLRLGEDPPRRVDADRLRETDPRRRASSSATGGRRRTLSRSPTFVVFLRSDGGTNRDGPATALVAWDAENIRAGNLVRSSALAVCAPLLALGLGLPILLGSLFVAPIRGVIAGVRRWDRSGSPWARRLPPLTARSAVLFLLSAWDLIGLRTWAW